MSKLAFREDKKTGVIRCYFSSLDDTDRTEVGTMSAALCRKVPDLFGRWVAVMQTAYKVAIEESTGAEVTGFHTYRPGDKN